MEENSINTFISKDLETGYRMSNTIKPNGKLRQISNDVESEVKTTKQWSKSSY